MEAIKQYRTKAEFIRSLRRGPIVLKWTGMIGPIHWAVKPPVYETVQTVTGPKKRWKCKVRVRRGMAVEVL